MAIEQFLTFQKFNRIKLSPINYLLFGCMFISINIVDAQTNAPLFESVSSTTSNINFKNILPYKKNFNIIRYYYYYNGGGVAIGDINNDGLMDIYFTANSFGGNKLYLNKGNMVFEDITLKAGVAGTADRSGGVTMADVNGDGFLDIYVSVISKYFKLKGSNQLFINNGDGTFRDEAAAYGLDINGYTSQTAFFDYDHDGDLDCFILSQSTIVTDGVRNIKTRQTKSPYFSSRLMRNELSAGKKTFVDVSNQSGIYQSDVGFGLGISVADINNDGWEDIYIGNDFYENDYYYVNNGNGTFSEKGADKFGHFSMYSMGNDVADINNDGQLDIITLDMLPREEKNLKSINVAQGYDIYNYSIIGNGYQYQNSQNCLQINNGDGSSFSEVALSSGVADTDWSWAPLFADFDNDGNKDLLVTSGIPRYIIDGDFLAYSKSNGIQFANDTSDNVDLKSINNAPVRDSHPFVFKGNGDASFADVSELWGVEKLKGWTSGAAYGDFDNDGDLDLVLNATNDQAILLKNNSNTQGFISFSFKSKSLNTAAIGTKVYLYVNGNVQYQQLMPTRGFQSSVEPRLHFGLNNNKVDSVLIVWPNQKQTILKDVKINEHHVIIENTEGLTYIPEKFTVKNKLAFKNITDSIVCDWSHVENNIADFRIQALIPQAKSNRGPKIAIADVNRDGLDDFYTCGASGQTRVLMIQSANGDFIKKNNTSFDSDIECEDEDAVFFDCDNDGDQDLYISSGGNMYLESNPQLLDRLYINDGLGNFTKNSEALPKIYQDKSTVKIVDIDNDNDMDIFICGFLNPIAYGIPQSSYLLVNDGTGKFNEFEGNALFKDLGMVTSAQITDVNKDGLKDIVVVGEWMPICVFTNKGSSFVKTIIPNSSGLWQSIFADDVNGDGDIDFVLGNWGHNNKFWSYKTSPLRLYVSDFDKNGRVEQLISYVYKGVEYPFYSKPATERAIPFIKKKYLHFNDYAGVPFKQIFGDKLLGVEPLLAENLSSCIAYGNGKGNFELEKLPNNLQYAPINAIAKGYTKNTYLLGGNQFGVTPNEGRYDAQPLALFNVNNKKVTRLPQQNLDEIKGEIKDLKWITTANQGKVLMAARNNGKLLFYKPNASN